MKGAARPAQSPQGSFLSRTAGDLYPGSFALVMATGIISSAAHLLSFSLLARVLLALNGFFFIILWALTLVRLAAYFPRFLGDLLGHATGPGFFTLVAGTCVLGTQVALITGDYRLSTALWFLGLALWIVLTCAFFASVISRGSKPPLAAGINGGWLVSVVATQSISVLATVLAAVSPSSGQGLFFLSLCFCLAGGMLYVILMTLLFYRLVFFPLAPGELSPLSWISMGAAAITTLSGARLLASAQQWSFLDGLRPFLEGYTVLFWSTATWWIPLLVCLGVWRYIIRRFPLRYEPQLWGMVFPLGMYTACTIMTARAAGLSFLMAIPEVFLWIALAAWISVFLGMLPAVARSFRRPCVATGQKGSS